MGTCSMSIGHFKVIRPEMCGLISTKISVASLCGFQLLYVRYISMRPLNTIQPESFLNYVDQNFYSNRPVGFPLYKREYFYLFHICSIVCVGINMIFLVYMRGHATISPVISSDNKPMRFRIEYNPVNTL